MQRPNKFYVTLSLALVLFLLGFIAYWAWRADHLSTQFQESLDVVVELEENHTLDQRRRLMAYLQEARYANPRREVRFESKETALSKLDRELTADLETFGVNNPLLDVLLFNVSLPYMDTDSLDQIANEVQLQPGVSGVFYQENFFGGIALNARRITYILAGLTVLFLLIAMVLIHNTVRLSLAANRLLIKTQELVGAGWGFIARPYLLRGIWQGLLAGLLAVLVLGSLLFAADQYLPELNIFGHPQALVVIGTGMLCVGMLVSFVSYYVGVRRYLRLPIDQLR